jgi:hypothetical protein
MTLLVPVTSPTPLSIDRVLAFAAANVHDNFVASPRVMLAGSAEKLVMAGAPEETPVVD